MPRAIYILHYHPKLIHIFIHVPTYQPTSPRLNASFWERNEKIIKMELCSFHLSTSLYGMVVFFSRFLVMNKNSFFFFCSQTIFHSFQCYDRSFSFPAKNFVLTHVRIVILCVWSHLYLSYVVAKIALPIMFILNLDAVCVASFLFSFIIFFHCFPFLILPFRLIWIKF